MTTTTEVPATTAEVLEKALEVMRERGMCKKKLEDGDGRVCARGAIFVAMDALGVRTTTDNWLVPDGVVAAAARYLHPPLGGFNAAVDFNNLPDTTQAEVEAVFEEALRMAREEEA